MVERVGINKLSEERCFLRNIQLSIFANRWLHIINVVSGLKLTKLIMCSTDVKLVQMKPGESITTNFIPNNDLHYYVFRGRRNTVVMAFSKTGLIIYKSLDTTDRIAYIIYFEDLPTPKLESVLDNCKVITLRMDFKASVFLIIHRRLAVF